MVRRLLPETLARRIPFVGKLSEYFSHRAAQRAGRHPIGLLKLIPFAVALDLIDAFDWSVPVVGPAVTFVVETAFVLGITGRARYAIGLAGLDALPLVSIMPVATLTLLSCIRDAYQEAEARFTPTGPVIDTTGTIGT